MSKVLWCVINGLASAPPASDWSIGVSISKKFFSSNHLLIRLIHFALVLNTFFDKGLTIKSRYLCLYLFSISVKPCHLSGKGCNDLDNISHLDTFIESSPLLVFLIVPKTPIQSPISTISLRSSKESSFALISKSSRIFFSK